MIRFSIYSFLIPAQAIAYVCLCGPTDGQMPVITVYTEEASHKKGIVPDHYSLLHLIMRLFVLQVCGGWELE